MSSNSSTLEAGGNPRRPTAGRRRLTGFTVALRLCQQTHITVSAQY